LACNPVNSAQSEAVVEGGTNPPESDGVSNNVSTSDDKASQSRPQALNGPLALPGDAFGQIAEFWGFLQTFALPLGIECIPSLQRLSDAVQMFDTFKRVLSAQVKNCSKSFEVVSSVSQPSMTFREAENLLSGIAIALTSKLLPEFNHAIGLALNDPLFCGCSVEVNALNWKEIVRYFRFHSYFRDFA